jgi:hypothetical protein
MNQTKIVIFGQYKTGTTALFYKIKNSLPHNTKTLFEPDEYVYETNDNNRFVLAKVILGKPEIVNYATFLNFDKKIYITRDPRDWVVSGTLFIIQQMPELYNNHENLSSILHLLQQKEKTPADISLVQILDRIYEMLGLTLDASNNLIKSMHSWLFDFELKLDNYYRLKYEDFVVNNLRDLEEYLEIPLSGKQVVPAQHSHVIRTKYYGDWANWFTNEDIAFFKPLLDAYVKQYNYDDNWDLNKTQVISPEHCSQYVERIVAKRINES